MLTIYKDPLRNVLDTFFEKEPSRNNSVKFLEKDDKYFIYLTVPGLTKEDLTISVKEELLTISYKKEEKDDDNFTFLNSFKKSYLIPNDISEKDIGGSVKNGILEIILPKSKEKIKERIISLK